MIEAQRAHREFWILQEPGSNRALLREAGEKWPDDINGEPSEKFIHVIEYAAAEVLVKALWDIDIHCIPAHKNNEHRILFEKIKDEALKAWRLESRTESK